MSAAATLHVTGGGRLAGDVPIAGFKHAAVTVIAASVLARAPVHVTNVPSVEDVAVLNAVLRRLGAEVAHSGGALRVDPLGLTGTHVPDDLAVRVHGVLYLVPALLARRGHARLGRTGGCPIGGPELPGRRPTRHVAHVLERFGARVACTGGAIEASAPRLRAAQIDLRDYAEVGSWPPTGPLYSGATKTAILAAASAQGTSVLRHPYPKLDVTALLAALAAAGVAIEQDGERIAIEGRPDGIDGFACALPSDQLELLTFVAAAVRTGSRLHLTELTAAALREAARPELEAVAQMGVELEWEGAGVTVRPPSGPLRPRELVISSHGIFSDAHPLLALMLLGARGRSSIRETVWTERFAYVDELRKLGARLERGEARVAIEPGALRPSARTLVAGDVRSAATLLVAALGVPGRTAITGVEHLERGYDDLVGKLVRVGARIATADVAERPSTPRRICVLGSPGSGKSRFARALAARTGLPLHQLDDRYWGAGWTRPPAEAWMREVERLACQPAWIIDGNYAATLRPRLERCDALVLFDRPTSACLAGVGRRMLAIALGDRTRLPLAVRDAPGARASEDVVGFLLRVARFRRHVLPHVRDLIGSVASDRLVLHVRSRPAAAQVLERLAACIRGSVDHPARSPDLDDMRDDRPASDMGEARQRSPGRPAAPPDGERVELAAFDAGWSERFRAAAAELRSALRDLAERIDHVGSTAIEDLIAKPVIDVQISIASWANEQPVAERLATLGYALLPDPEEPAHRFFRRPAERPRRVNIHVCERGGAWERRHLLFRDFLRADLATREAYAQAKREAAARHGENRYDYTDAKAPFIRFAEATAERWAQRTGWTLPASDA